jgi:hypothetical protein
LTDAVEKVRGATPKRNKRIEPNNILNLCCEYGSSLESMLRGKTHKILFRQYRPETDIGGTLLKRYGPLDDTHRRFRHRTRLPVANARDLARSSQRRKTDDDGDRAGCRPHPSADGFVTSLTPAATAVIFTVTYAGIALGRLPGLRLDRAGIALVGAVLMVAVGALTPAEAYGAVDLNTIVLLLGMMIVVAHLKLSGLFRAAQRPSRETRKT